MRTILLTLIALSSMAGAQTASPQQLASMAASAVSFTNTTNTAGELASPNCSSTATVNAGSAVAPPMAVPAPAKPPPVIPLLPVQVRMSAELALRTYESRATEQVSSLGAYSDTTIVEAVLPNSNQCGQFELRQAYVIPQTMNFTPVSFVGDNFVKVNVIIRVLKSEADHVRKQQGAETAITHQNYTFTFKGEEDVAGRATYVFEVKPRHKSPGLFKGRVLIDPYTGTLFRVEGKLVKSPSWFIRKIEFAQEYAQIGTFTLPVHLHAVSNVRIIGPVVVDVFHRDYEVQVAAPDSIAAGYAGRESEWSSTGLPPAVPDAGN